MGGYKPGQISTRKRTPARQFEIIEWIQGDAKSGSATSWLQCDGDCRIKLKFFLARSLSLSRHSQHQRKSEGFYAGPPPSDERRRSSVISSKGTQSNPADKGFHSRERIPLGRGTLFPCVGVWQSFWRPTSFVVVRCYFCIIILIIGRWRLTFLNNNNNNNTCSLTFIFS